jgi:hypothetical protein
MAITEYFYTESQPVRCLEIKVPVVVAKTNIEVAVDVIKDMPELVLKVDRIEATVRDLKGKPFFVEEVSPGEYELVPMKDKERNVLVKKVVVSGTLHKQIFYVNKNNESKHVGEDVPFTKLVELQELKPVQNKKDVFVQFHNVDAEVNWELPRASRLHQTGIIEMTVKVVEDRQIFVQTCPTPGVVPPGNLLKDGGLEIWADPTHPVFWGASNVARCDIAHSGSYSAELGALSPIRPASLYQMVTTGIMGGRQYRLSFWARENKKDGMMPVSAFVLNAEVVFFNQHGVQVGIGSQVVPSGQVPETNFTQIQFVTHMTDDSVASALVRFTYVPEPGNTNMVKIDDVILESLP